MAVGIEHVDGVVAHALDQQAEALLAGHQRLVNDPAVGDVAGDLGVADDLAALADHRIDDHMGPEAGAILAQPPAFGLKPALGRGRVQGSGGQADGAVFFGVEDREVLADDLVGRVALEALGAGIPGRYVAVCVEKIDGVVLDRSTSI